MRPSLKARRKFNARGFQSASSSSKSNERVHDAAFACVFTGYGIFSGRSDLSPSYKVMLKSRTMIQLTPGHSIQMWHRTTADDCGAFYLPPLSGHDEIGIPSTALGASQSR
jgi:hypothetical protein